jgi:hypothetical protein
MVEIKEKVKGSSFDDHGGADYVNESRGARRFVARSWRRGDGHIRNDRRGDFANESEK